MLDTVLSAARLIVLAAAPVAFLVACGDDVTGPLWGARSFRLQTVNGNSIPATGGYSVDLVGGRLRVVSDTLLSETLVFACKDPLPAGVISCVTDPNGTSRLLRYYVTEGRVRLLDCPGPTEFDCRGAASFSRDSIVVQYGRYPELGPRLKFLRE